MLFNLASTMLAFAPPFYFAILTFFVFSLGTPPAESSSSFSYPRFDKSTNWSSDVALYGSAKVVDGASAVRLTASATSGAGRIMYRKPIKLVEGKPWKLVSFTTYFEFSLSTYNGDGLAFFVAPSGHGAAVFGNTSFGLSLGVESNKTQVVAVEFDTSKDVKYEDMNQNHVGIDVGSLVSVETRNLSSVNLTLGSGHKLRSWIDYAAYSKRLEVRLSRLGGSRPQDPLLSYSLDVSKLWKDEDVVVGLSSSNANSSQTCLVYSWSFKLRHVPEWMHSEPLDPEAVADVNKNVTVRKKGDCILGMLSALVFGTACGALGAFVVLYLWTIFGSRRPVVPEEFTACPEEVHYKKVMALVDKAVEDGNK